MNGEGSSRAPRSSTFQSAQWLDEFLAKRELTTPDERPLCTYRCSDEEYETLVQILRGRSLDTGKSSATAAQTSACFCLFASEWWRRNYSGGPWKWQHLLGEIGFLPHSNQDLYRIVERGLRFWQRPLIMVGQGRGFLVTLACEGGLPLQLIRKEGTRLRTFFKALLEEFQIYRKTFVEPATLAERVADRLPHSLRQDVVFRVSGELVEHIWTLQSRVSDISNPVEALDTLDPEWRGELPIQIEDETALALLKNLVEEASRLSSAEPTRISVKRTLYESHAGWILAARVELPGATLAAELAALLGISPNELHSRLELYATGDNERLHLIGLASQRSGKGQTEFLLERSRERQFVLRDQDAASELRLIVSSSGDPLTATDLPHGQALSDVPWVFVEMASSDDLRFVGEGSARVRHPEAFVAAPDTITIAPLDDSSATRVGELRGISRGLYRISGEVRFTDPDGSASVIRTGQSHEESPEYRLHGQSVNVGAGRTSWLKPPLKLIRYEPSSRPTIIGSVDIDWRSAGSGAWQSGPIAGVGLLDLRYQVDGELAFRRQVGVLPQAFQVSIDPGGTYNSGVLRIHGLGEGTVGWPDSPDLKVTQSAEPGGETVMLNCEAEQEPPVNVTVHVRWERGSPLTLTLPFPGRGVRFVTAAGATAPNYATVSWPTAQDLQVVATSARQQDTFILSGDLGAHDISQSLNRSLAIWKELPPDGAYRRRLYLSHLEDTFRQLFGATRDLDARVKLWVTGPGGQGKQVQVKRFDNVLQPDHENSLVSLEANAGDEQFDENNAATMRLEALCLWDLEKDPVPLARVPSGDNQSAYSWRIDESSMDPGPWLISAQDQSGSLIRPLLWVVQGTDKSGAAPAVDPDLSTAISISNRDDRHSAIQQRFQKLATDFEDPDWDFLINYFSAFRRLPAASLDLFWQVAESPTVAAGALLLASDHQFDAVWDRLEELPFSWQLVPVAAWLQGAERLHTLYRRQLAGLDTDIEAHLRAALSTFVHRAPLRLPTIGGIIGLIDAVVIPGLIDTRNSVGEHSQLISLGRNHAGRKALYHTLTNARQDLLQGQGAEWPHSGNFDKWRRDNAEIANAFDELWLSPPAGAGYRGDVLHAPVVAALSAACGAPLDTTLVCDIKRLRRFDERWFDIAYSVCLAIAIGRMLDTPQD